jgi:glycosyltransferase involved in cell wall biosynthesis
MGGSNIYLPRDWISLLISLFKANSTYNVLKVPGHLLAPMRLFCKLRKKSLVFWSQMSSDACPSERIRRRSIANILQNFGIKQSDIIIAQSKEQQTAYYQNYGIKARLVYSICERLELFDSIIQYSIFTKPVDILWVGNSHLRKQYEVVFELAKLLPNRQFAIAMGDCHSERYHLARLEADQLPNIKFLGSLSPMKMDKWYGNTRLFLSTSSKEGFPNTFLQSWMNKVPVISLSVDPDKIISRKGLGVVAATPNDIKALGSDYKSMAKLLLPNIESLLSSEQTIQAMGDRALTYIKETHSPNVVVPMLLNALETHSI